MILTVILVMFEALICSEFNINNYDNRQRQHGMTSLAIQESMTTKLRIY